MQMRKFLFERDGMTQLEFENATLGKKQFSVIS